MFLNILKISTSTVREMFLNIIVSIGCIHMGYFPFAQTNRKYEFALLN